MSKIVNYKGHDNTFGHNFTFLQDPEFGHRNTFGHQNAFALNATFGDDNKFGHVNSFHGNAKFGNRNHFGSNCAFGPTTRLGDDCTIEICSHIGNGFSHGARLTMEGVQVIRLMCLSNVDLAGEQVQIIVHTRGVRVRCGAMAGNLGEFCDWFQTRGGHALARIVRAAAEALRSEVSSSATGGWPTKIGE